MNTPSGAEPRGARGRRPFWKRALWIASAVLGALVLLAVVFLAFFADEIVESYAQQRATELQQRLKRPVEIGALEVSLLRGRARAQDVFIGPAKDEPPDAPALIVPEAHIDVAMWRTLLSLGRSPYVESLEARDAQVHVVRRPDGTLNWQHIAEGLRDTSEPSGEDEQQAEDDGGDATLKSLALTGASVRFVEMASARGEPAREASISQIDVRGTGLGSRGGGELSVQAAALAAERNVRMHAVLGQTDGDQAPAVERLELEVQPIELAPLAPFFAAARPAAVHAIERGVLSASLHVRERERRSVAEGYVKLASARFAEGQPFDAQLSVEATRDRDEESVNVQQLELAVNEMKLVASGRVDRSGEVPRFEALQVRSEALSFDRLRSVYPALDARTEPARLGGELALRASGSGDADSQQLQAELDLSSATIDIPDKLHKPRGTPLALQARVRTTPTRLDIQRATLELADFELRAEGHVSELGREQPRYAFTITTPQPAVASVLRLLPPVARERSEASLPGTLTIEASITGGGDERKADGTLQLAGLDVDVQGARLSGGGSATFRVQGDASQSDGRIEADFTKLAAVYQDVLAKQAGTPLRVDASWDRSGERTVAELGGRLATLPLRAKITLSGSAPHQRFAVDAKLPEFAVRPLLSIVPKAIERPIGDVHLQGEVHARGVTGQPSTLELDVPSFAARAGRSKVQGALSAKNLQDPQLELRVRADYLDTYELLPKTDARPAQSEAEQRGAQTSPLAKADGTIDVNVKAGKIAAIPVENLVAQLVLRDGRATAKRLDVGAFGGTLSATGSELPLVAERGPVHLKGELRGMQAQALLAHFARDEEVLRGAVSAAIDVRARDLSVDAVKSTLSGRMRGSLDEAEFLPANVYGKLADQLQGAAKVPALKQALASTEQRVAKATGGTWQLDDVQGALSFDDGAVLLDEPLTAKTPQGALSVRGRVSLEKASDLRASLALDPKAASSLTGGKVKVDEPVTVPFSVTGSLGDPRFAFEADRVLRELATDYVRSEGERAITKGVDRAIEEVAPKAEKKKVDEARKEIDKRLRDVF